MMMDYEKYFKKKVYTTEMQKMAWTEHLLFWTSKALYLIFYIIIPVYFVGWKAWAIGFGAMHVTLGLSLALVFQLAHVVEHTEFLFVEEHDTRKIEEEWEVTSTR